MKLKDIKIGMHVYYTPFVGCDPDLIEKGIVKGVTAKFAFVQYGNDFSSKATNAESLEISKED
jgi:hypothetical protein